jgi:hypothetical protein
VNICQYISSGNMPQVLLKYNSVWHYTEKSVKLATSVILPSVIATFLLNKKSYIYTCPNSLTCLPVYLASCSPSCNWHNCVHILTFLCWP